jgi:adenosylmethionine-8-amino-7-oxononanoate aminotransferase
MNTIPSAPAINQRTEESKRLQASDRAHIWHPFTQASEWEAEEALIVESGEGNWITDTDGNRYLDGISALWVNVHGHRNPKVDQAIRDQLDKIAHSTLLGLASPPSIELAERLATLAPGKLTRVFYSDSGSTAVEVALKMAYQHFQQRGQAGDKKRTRFLSFIDAYHGDTVGAVSLGGIDLFHSIYKPLLFDSHHAPYPHCYRCPLNKEPQSCEDACVAKLEELFKTYGSELCAVVIEPLVQGAAGIITSPPGYLKKVETLAKEYGVLLVCDEVATGFGRTGKMFAVEHEGVEPDFICLAKGISAGYLPLAATITTEAVYDAFRGNYEQHRTFYHGHSYTGNALACAAGVASLELFEDENILEKLQPKIARLESRLNEWVAPLTHVGDIRQRGTMIGIEIVADRATKAPFPPASRTGREVILAARKAGVMIRPLGDVVVLMPPLSITDEEIDLLVRETANAIIKVTEN